MALTNLLCAPLPLSFYCVSNLATTTYPMQPSADAALCSENRQGTDPKGHLVDTSLNCDRLLAVLLQHPSMCKLNIVCKLLATSKGLGAGVAAYCASAVPTLLSRGVRPAAYAAWISGHGHLMSSLHIHLTDPAAVTAVAVAMVKAVGAVSDGLQLKSFQACCISPAMLSCLSGPHLTSLTFESISPADNVHQAADIVATRLTALQQLRLKMPKQCVGLLPALRSLTNLQVSSTASWLCSNSTAAAASECSALQCLAIPTASCWPLRAHGW
jgi:hypothetical protein